MQYLKKERKSERKEKNIKMKNIFVAYICIKQKHAYFGESI